MTIVPESPATLRRKANAKWKAFQRKRRDRIIAELEDHDRHTGETHRDLEFARSEERSARTEWRKLEEQARAAAEHVEAVAA